MPSRHHRTPRGSRIVAGILVLLLAGLQWDVLQGVAWVGMLAKYSHDSGLKVAIRQTFDGEHPCPMCKAIRAARSPINPVPASVLASSGMQPAPDAALFSQRAAAAASRAGDCRFKMDAWTAASRPARPPIPPPRATA